MKHKTIIAALAAAASSSLLPGTANALIRDSLSGPDDVTTIRSALTVSTGDSRASGTSPIVTVAASDWFGNPRFGAGYYASAASGMYSAGTATGSNYLSVSANAFGETRTAFQSHIYSQSNGPAQTSGVYAYVYANGNLVRNTSRGGAQFNTTTYLNIVNQPIWGTTPGDDDVFAIGPLKFKAGATVRGTANQRVQGRVWVDGVDGYLSQGAGVTVTAWGGVDVYLASAGFRVNNLSLVQADLALKAKASYQFMSIGTGPNSPPACISIAYVGGQYGLWLQELAGSIVAYGSIFGFSDDYEIAKWPGLMQSKLLMNYPITSKQFGSCFPVPAAPVI